MWPALLRRPMSGERLVTTVSIAVLATVAAAMNVYAPTIFFDSQIMLGGSLGVFALLQFGWPGIVVGMAALVVTYVRWGHPFELLVGTGFLVWLRICLDRFAAGRADGGHASILLAATAYWLLFGLWLEMAFFRLAFGLDGVAAVSLGLKEAVSGLCNATLGFLLFAAVQAARSRNASGTRWTPDLASGFALAASTLPSISLVIILSGQVKDATLRAEFAEMRAFAMQAARAVSPDAGTTPDATAPARDDMTFAVLAAGRMLASSDRAFFANIARDYEAEIPSRTGIEDLAVYRPRRDAAVIAQDADSFVVATFPLSDAAGDAGPTHVTVARPLDVLVKTLDYGLIIPTLLVMLGFLVVGALVSRVVDTASERRVRAEQHDAETQRSLQAATERMQLAAAAAGIGFWSRDLAAEREEWDDQMLRIYGVSRDQFDGRWEPFVHPADLHRVQEETRLALEEHRSGEYVYRIVRPDGTVRHVKGMSLAVGDAGGRPTHELGVNFDITPQVEAEAALAAAREQERRHEQAHRQELHTKLKTSLNAAAVAHEINQPLSRVLLRARIGLQTATGRDHDMLAALVADAERVVTIIQKMKVLLRNVETVQSEVDLADITASAMHQVKRPLREGGVVVTRGGVERGCVVLGDEVQLQMIVTNLVINAVEAIIHGDGDRREILVDHRVQADAVELIIGDSGPGWPGGTIDEMLLQTTKPAGAGIGLYVVKTAVENHRGQITVGGSPLGGAEFRITFPRGAAAAAPS